MRSVLCAFALGSLAVQANAWTTNVEGPDVFGNTKVIATEIGIQNSLVIQCDSTGELFLAFIEKKKEFDDVTEVAAKFYLKTTKEPPIILQASTRAWNDNYFGIVVNKDEPFIVKALEAIGAAKSKIEVGIEIGGSQFSASHSSRGSGKAIEKVKSNCKLPIAIQN